MIEYAVETLTPELIKETESAQQGYWKECARPFLNFPVDVDWPTYITAQKMSMLRVIVARESGQMAGAAFEIIAPDPHFACITASLPMLYLKPEHRKGYAGVRLIKLAEQYAVEGGAQELMTHGGIHNDVSRLFENMGYFDWGRYFVKNLKGSSPYPVFKRGIQCHS